MKALVTGVSGFTGRHLRALLEAEGVEVYSLANAEIESGDYRAVGVADSAVMCTCIEDVAPDCIFHLAGTAVAFEPAEYYSVNAGFAATLFNSLEETEHTACPVLLVGTAAEYGPVAAEDLPVDEGYPCRPVSHYGISKYAQTLGGLAAAKHGQPVVVVRPFNLIGAGCPDHLVLGSTVGHLAEAAASGAGEITLDDLSATRDFVDVKDAVRCYWELIRNPAAYGQVVNICTGTARPVRELVERLIALSGLDVTLDAPTGAGDSQSRGCTKRLRELLGWVPSADLDDALRAALDAEGICR